MNISEERLEVLRALSFDKQTRLLNDPILPEKIKAVLSSIERFAGEHKKESACVKELNSLYEQYGPPIIRSVLEHSFLLHRVSEINNIFSSLLEMLAKDIRDNSELASQISNELGRFSHYPYEATHRIIDLVLELLAKVKGQLGLIIGNENTTYSLRYKAAMFVVKRKEIKEYSSIVNLIDELSSADSYESFQIHIFPLIKLLSNTGKEGLEFVIRAYSKGHLAKHGPLIIASFGDTFHAWFKDNIQPLSKKWARVLIQAWPRSHDIRSRDWMLSLLVDEWARCPEIGDYLRHLLHRALNERKTYLASCGDNTRKKVLLFVGSHENYIQEVIDEVMSNFQQEPDVWEIFAKRTVYQDRAAGIAVAEVLGQLDTARMNKLFDWAETMHSSRFLTGLFSRLLSPNIFSKLSKDTQSRILSSSVIQPNVGSEQINAILRSSAVPDQKVRRQLNDLHTDLVKKHGTTPTGKGNGILE